MSKISAERALQKLLTDMYAYPREYMWEDRDEDYIGAYTQAVKDIAILTFPAYVWTKILGQ